MSAFQRVISEMGPATTKTRKPAAVAAAIGNVLEWYDFTVYAFLAGTIGKLFFPRASEIDQLVAAFGVFAAGYLMRPIGGVVFGHVGDRYGRKPVLVFSSIAMALPTFAVGILPTDAQIGPIAAVLLVIMRLLQGLSIGGEYTGSVVYLAEYANSRKRGLLCTASIVGAGVGTLIGSFATDIINVFLTPDAVESWGWRLPFLAGALVGFVGWYLRRNLPETQTPTSSETPRRPPIIETVTEDWRLVLQVVGLNIMHAVAFFMIFIFIKTYMHSFVGFAQTQALTISTIGMVALMMATPAFGALSDRVGRRPVLIGSATSAIILAYPLFLLIDSGIFLIALACQLAFALIVGSYSGTSPSAMTELMPSRVRVTGTSLGYNLCMAIFGGTTPMIAVMLIKATGVNAAPAIYVILAAVVSLLVVIRLPEPAHSPFNRRNIGAQNG